MTRPSASCCIVRRDVMQQSARIMALASAGARDIPGEQKPGTPAGKPGESEEDDKSMGSKEDGDRTDG